MRRKLIVIVLTLLSVGAQAQLSTIDSLTNVISARQGIGKYDPIVTLLRTYANAGKDTEALGWANEARKIAYQYGDTAKIVQASRMVGQLYNRLLMYKEAEAILLATTPIAKRHHLRNDYGIMLENFGIIYTSHAKYDKALNFYFQVLAIAEEDKDQEHASMVLNNIGVVYYKLKDYSKGLTYFKRALELKNKISDDYDYERTLVNMSLALAYLQEYGSAKKLVDSTLIYCKKKDCKKDVFTDANFCLGVIHFGLRELDTAEHYFIKSFNLAKASENSRYQFDNIDYLLQIYILKNRVADALLYLNEAEGIIDRDDGLNLEMIKIYSRFFQFYAKTGDVKKVAFYQQKYIRLKDSIYNEQLTNNLMELEAQHAERENKARIASQEQLLTLKEEVIKGQRLVNILVGSLVLVLIGLAAILIRINRQKQKINLLLDQKVSERTEELERKSDELLRKHEERSLLIDQTSYNIKASVGQIKELCTVGLADIRDAKAKEYIDKMNHASDQLSLSLRSFHTASRLNPLLSSALKAR